MCPLEPPSKAKALTESMELEKKAEGPQALKSPKAGCSISNKLFPWHAATSMCSPTIQGRFRHSDAGTTHGVAHSAGPSYRKFADPLCG